MVQASVVRHDVEDIGGGGQGDSVIEIYDEQGIVGNVGRNDARTNSAILRDAQPGVHWVRVVAPDPRLTFDYTLRLFREAGPRGCPRDRFDAEGDNGERGTATEVQPQLYVDLTLCGSDDDVDWYCFDLEGVAAVSVEIESPPGGNILMLDLFDPDGTRKTNDSTMSCASATPTNARRSTRRPPGRCGPSSKRTIEP